LDLSTDHQLMLAARDGDIEKLGILFERHHKHLYNFFLRQTLNQQISEDLVQEVFFRLLKYRHTYQGQGKFTTWLFQIARNARIDFLKKYGRKTEPIEVVEQLANDDANPEENVAQDSDIMLMRTALAKLSPDKREVLILSRFQNMRYRQIAQILGCRVGTIKARVFRALKDLTKIYNDLAGERQL